ncbi:hypothetical protein BY458DRAFT_506748 [Sporodiniella umbellata]|nr:hypothetical protein BY458DRAFT_506748 [Sporodiniella umbellata]
MLKRIQNAWPIPLAMLPRLGGWLVGSRNDWEDFIMIVMVLYVVYQCITAPWHYYESARAYRVVRFREKRAEEKELQLHEMIGLGCVLFSPAVAGWALEASHRLLHHTQYMSSFNIKVFVIAASLKPIFHLSALIQERTLFLVNERPREEGKLSLFHQKLDLMEEAMDALRQAYATRHDLGQVTREVTPHLQHLTLAMQEIETRDQAYYLGSKDRFDAMDRKLKEMERFLCLVEPESKTLWAFLPFRLAYYAIQRSIGLLPSALLTSSKNPSKESFL